ncbi:MAG: hypothetical protein KDD53_02045, partial [Bdellovibrionales bacterium]|nr:hypothetical protein [Bdellovibrionales bacterium]
MSKLKGVAGKPFSQGLQASELESFLEKDGRLQQAIELAETRMDQLRNECPDLVCLDEKSLISKLQNGILNFYPPDNVSPYVPLAAKGPWIVTITGSVIFDTGGYGMLGLGHDPDVVRQAMAEPYVMANVMTPSLSQYKFIHALKSRIGSSRAECPFSSFVCINSGS